MLDNNNTGHEPEYLLIIFSGIIAMMGGVCKELSNFESCFNLRKFLSNIFISFFSGVILSLFLNDFEHKTIVMGLAGCAGLTGCAMVDYFTAIFKALVIHAASKAVGHEIKVKERAKRIYKKKRK
jgi:hypothetical protein